MRKLIFLLLLPTLANAQAIQSKVCLRNPATNFAAPCAFDNPTVAGNLLIVATFGGCTSGTCNPISDNQENRWKLAIAVPYYNGSVLDYSLDTHGGPETVSFGPNGAWLAIIAEYPPSSGLDKTAYNTYAWNNLDAKPGESNDLGWAGPIETSEPGELIIAWGFNGALNPCCGTVEPGPSFALRGVAEGGFIMEDMITGKPGLYIASVEFAGYAHWNLGCVSFKMRKP